MTVNYRPTQGLDKVYAYNLATKTVLSGWPFDVWSWPKGYPAITDIDNDNLQDVCIATDSGELFAIAYDGQVLNGFPKVMHAASISGVAVGDIDGDNLFELVASTSDGWVYAWDTTGAALPERADWPMRGVNARYTGVQPQSPPAAPTLEMLGSCPGKARFKTTGMTPNKNVAYLYAKGIGSFKVPNGNPCAGIVLGLNQSVAVAAIVSADGAGIAKFDVRLPSNACGNIYMQAIDLNACNTTDVILIQ